MENIIKKSMGVVLILLISLSSFSGCIENSSFHIHFFKQKMDATKHFMECSCGEIKDSAEHTFDWRSDFTHKECTSCGYMVKENTPLILEKNEDGTIKLKEELVSTLSKYLEKYRLIGDPFPFDFSDKLNIIRNEECSPLLVKFSRESYYVAAYCNITHESPESETVFFCCHSEYTWVGFENAEDVKGTWEDKKLIAAFQINPQEFCVNIKTDSSDIIMDHFALYNPEFADGVAINPKITFENLFIYLSRNEDKYIGYSSLHSSTHHKLCSFKCIELEGKYYVMERHSTERNDGIYEKNDLVREYGVYYDQLMALLVDEYSVKDDNKTTNYGLFKIEDIAKIMK